MAKLSVMIVFSTLLSNIHGRLLLESLFQFPRAALVFLCCWISEEECFCCPLHESRLTGWLTAQTFTKILKKTRAEIYV